MRILLIILGLLLFSCGKNKQGVFPKYSERKKEKDSIFIRNYYKNGLIENQGYTNSQGLKFGKWDYYKKNGQIDKTIEFMIISEKQYTNQGWYYNKIKTDTVK